MAIYFKISLIDQGFWHWWYPVSLLMILVWRAGMQEFLALAPGLVAKLTSLRMPSCCHYSYSSSFAWLSSIFVLIEFALVLSRLRVLVETDLSGLGYQGGWGSVNLGKIVSQSKSWAVVAVIRYKVFHVVVHRSWTTTFHAWLLVQSLHLD